jgi:GNAT superfamily N-acetyltransferase
MEIREVEEPNLGPFFDLMGEVEAGSHFDPANEEHAAWLRERIGRHRGNSVRFYGLYGDHADPLGIIGILIEDYINIDWRLGYITDLGVIAQHRKHGFGSRLLQFAVELAKRERCYCLYVDTYAGSSDNVAFYARNGFVPVATLPDQNGPGDEGQVWMRQLLWEGEERS